MEETSYQVPRTASVSYGCRVFRLIYTCSFTVNLLAVAFCAQFNCPPLDLPSKDSRIRNFHYDSEWVEQRDAANQRDRQVLQGRLSAAQSHLHKEAIRSAYVALAQHDVQTGNVRDAMGYLLRATDYCTNRSQTAHLSLLILELALALPNYPQVRDYVTKVELTLGGTPSAVGAVGLGGLGGQGSAAQPPNASSSTMSGTTSTHLVATKLKIVSGLERLAQGDFVAASNILTALVMTPANPGTSLASAPSNWEWSAVTCPEEIAFYAALLALATQDRSQIIQLAEHPEALELVPAMKELLVQFSRANYQACCSCFVPDNKTASYNIAASSLSSSTGADISSKSGTSILPFVEGGGCGGGTDLYLTKHWSTLCTKIRDRCLMEYLKPYQCIQMDIMAKQFQPMTSDELQDILVDLVGRGMVPNARMDARARVFTKSASQKSSSTSKALKHKLAKLEHRVLDDTYALLIRLGCLENEICVQDNTTPGGRGGRMGLSTGAVVRGSGGYEDDYHRGLGGYTHPHYADGDDDLSSDDEGDTPMLDVSGEINPEDLY
jgi:hypothetical protein